MKEGQASRTAELVCAGRATADGRVANFRDPTAMRLLPAEVQKRVEWVRSGRPPPNLRARMYRAYLERQSRVMATRTMAIDGAVREAGHSQVVILGAGLDGRAWRLDALQNATVFEVDHPDSQRDKRSRIEGLSQVAKDLRFVAVNFERDDLDTALQQAGHDASQPTTWIWEGVVMYLVPRDIEASLKIIQRRSAKGSRLAVLYHAPALLVRVLGLALARLGEPLKSSYKRDEMRALLERYGMRVTTDASMAEFGAQLGPELSKGTRPIRHLRLAVADFTSA